MILTLVFFILASLILGVTTYMGYKGQEELEVQTKGGRGKRESRAPADENLVSPKFSSNRRWHRRRAGSKT